MNTLRTRLIGLLMVVCSAGLAYISVYRTLEQAWQHADRLSYVGKVVFIVPVGAILGLAYILFPQTESLLLNERRRLTLIGWVFVPVFIGIGFAFEFWFEQQLRALGYNI